MTTFLGMRHIALVVSDLERASAFYQQAFGMFPFGAPKRGGMAQPLVSPGFKDQITLVARETDSEAGFAHGRPGDRGGIDHFGFMISAGADLQQVRHKMESAGATFVRQVDVAPGVPSLFFTDPDGYLIQLTRFPRLTRIYLVYLQLRALFQRIARSLEKKSSRQG